MNYFICFLYFFVFFNYIKALICLVFLGSFILSWFCCLELRVAF